MAGPVDRVLGEDVPGAPDEVRSHYVDLTNISDVHPLVVAVASLSRTDTGDGYVQVYRVRDRIPLGILTLPITYTARLEVPSVGPVLTQARQFPAVRLDSVVSFDPTAAGTRLTERIRFRAPWPLLGVTVRQAVQAHKEMLAGIRRHFEART
ncbi:SRPBCC family protein [Mycobacterium sp. CVI_P3]|uniref:SRPBCC family protein n=1 Tax=Mycobacterium pinniadriaticum TaxID=2994102 RepID=A0ABT3SCT9_9MYCO|nr:SRPBCC family protein [Mycobacterium pinniadriaticum]MCX2930915.1 SRPBCC family protein [Mycobacterium pinniadriaticum]MCX2937339.1 SRPBCC family protein [Mycobacterium pinniadriaticum]